MSEILSTKRRIILVGIPLLAAVLAGCGSDNSTDSSGEGTGTDAQTIAVEYRLDGSRLLTHERDGGYATILQVCDGKDLLEQTEFLVRSGNAIARSVGHPACADGRLTPEDFPSGS